MIFASARNGVIGRDGKLPWRLSEDLRRFKRLTTGGVVVMGRRTWEGLPGPLVDRYNVVVGRSLLRSPPIGCRAVDIGDLDQLLATDYAKFPAFIIGGAMLFRAYLPFVDRIHWTQVDADVDGDTVFDFRPDHDDGWKMVASEDVPADAENEYKSTYMIFDRK
jgi:dihydrofolate reductase